MAHPFGHVLSQSLCTVFVGQMTIRARYANFLMLGIGAIHQHHWVVIGLYDQIIRFGDDGFYFVCHMTNVCHQCKDDVTACYLITYIVRTVMWYTKRSNGEITQLKRLFFINDLHVCWGNLLMHTIIALYARMNKLRRIDW